MSEPIEQRPVAGASEPTATPIKVSVIVPTYCPGDGINRVVRSMKQQSLPTDEFEVIFVDDGSPDDTYRRLEEIRDDSPNVRIARIPNSGWPSTPRNVGIEMARGEYVLFMDHDDELYQNALSASYDYATANAADVLSPKESKTTDVGWGITNYTRNIPNARETRGISSLMPMMPHKFYRREFLNEHGIRFPEGRRMLWEDAYFNIEAYRHASVISILSDTPVYRWVHTGENNSSSYGPDREEFWEKLIRLFDFIQRTLPDPEFTSARESILTHLFRTKVLGRFDGQLGTGDENGVPMAVDNINRILTEYMPEDFDRKYGKFIRGRMYLLQAGRIDLMRELRRHEAGMVGISRTEDVRWEDGKLVIVAVTTWTDSDGEPIRLYERDGRVLRRLSPELEAVLPSDLLDVTDDIGKAKTEITIRSRSEHVTWAVPTRSEVRIARGDDSAVVVSVVATAVLDIDRAIFGAPLVDAVWDFHARNTVLGMLNHRALRAALDPQPALKSGKCAIAYANDNGMLSLDLRQKIRSIVSDGIAVADKVSTRRLSKGLVAFALPIDGVAIDGRTDIAGEVGLDRLGGFLARVAGSARVARLPAVGPLVGRALGRKPARLLADEKGVRLEGVLRAVPGRYTLVVVFQGRTVAAPIRVSVALDGRMTFSRIQAGAKP